ncbi:hypothetical protein ANN_12591 [Periplaneta americana]|uniref:Uncharacterized protein n=1 Tax=Periplaneta americana TaxID=6978 RepID=A0ABQ8TJP4_PERAM|nr:hypothetical protein ANN_12591 [Periplaneta americana]
MELYWKEWVKKDDAETNWKDEKELVASLAEKKLPTEGCTGRNGEREKSSGQKKVSDDRRLTIRADLEDHRWSADHSLRNAALYETGTHIGEVSRGTTTDDGGAQPPKHVWGFSLNEALQMIQGDQVAIPKCNNISITISSPKNACGNVTDEDSGDENNPTIDNMPGSQLRAETEVTLNTQGEGMDDYDDESHNGDDEHSKGDGKREDGNGTIKELKWETLENRRRKTRITSLYRAHLGQKAWVDITARLEKPTYYGRNDHDFKIKCRKQKTDVGVVSICDVLTPHYTTQTHPHRKQNKRRQEQQQPVLKKTNNRSKHVNQVR